MQNKTMYILRSPLYSAIIIFIAVFIAYSNTFNASFHFDDRYTITEDIEIKDAGNIGKILTNPLGRPLLRASFAINYMIGGSSVTTYHMVNTALHAGTAIAIFLLAQLLIKTFRPEDEDLAAFGPISSSLVFALHPLYTGSVTYISSRSAVMAALFSLISLYFLIKAATEKNSILHTALGLFFFALALLTKETTASLALIYAAFILIARLSGTIETEKRHMYTIIAMIAPILLFVAYRYATTGMVLPHDPRIHEEVLAPYPYFLTELKVIAFYYIWWLIAPFWNPHVDPDIPFTRSFFNVETIGALIVICALLYIAWRVRKKEPLIAFGILWFFLALSPTSSFFPLADVAVERHMYLPGIGFSLIFGALIGKARSEVTAKTLLPSLAVFFVILGALTLYANTRWKTELTLWNHAAEESPDKIRVLNNRAWGYYLAGIYDTSEMYYKKLLEKHPEYPYGHNNLGMVYMESGDYKAAIKEFQKALEIRPNTSIFIANLANAYESSGQLDKAIKEYLRAVQLDQSNPVILTQLSSALAKKGDFRNSLLAASMAVQINPRMPMPHYIIGYSLEMTKDYRGAAASYENALKLSPGWELPAARLRNLMNK